MSRFFTVRLLAIVGALLLLVPSMVQAAAVAEASTANPVALPIASTGNTAAPMDSGLTRSDLVGLVQPAVVRIVSHFSGTTTVPNFTLDLKTLTWQVDMSTSTPLPYDDYMLGSGFVVNEGGYIVTNSHVVSSAELVSKLASNLAQQVVLYENLVYSARKTAKLDALSSDRLSALIDTGTQFIEQHVSIAPPTVVVLKPGTPLPATSTPISVLQEQQNLQGPYAPITKLVQSGVSAHIVSVNNNYLNDEKDVALLKVPETNLPVIHLAQPGSVREGDQIYVISFPGSADLGSYSVQPSFTSGTVSALKSSAQHTFSYLQTDADVSPGSSGSPMLDASGQTVAVTTLSMTSSSGGTAFAFGIPISLVSQMLAAQGVSNTTSGDYATYLRKGIALEAAQHCAAAKKQFTLAEETNPVFGSVASFVDPHMKACEALIASGRSIDTWFDYATSWFSTQTVEFWILFMLAAALIGGLAVGVFVLMSHLRKDEGLLRELQRREAQDEAELHTLEMRARPVAPVPLVPQAPIAVPVLPTQTDAQTPAEPTTESEDLTAPMEPPRKPRVVNLLAPESAEIFSTGTPPPPPQPE